MLCPRTGDPLFCKNGAVSASLRTEVPLFDVIMTKLGLKWENSGTSVRITGKNHYFDANSGSCVRFINDRASSFILL